MSASSGGGAGEAGGGDPGGRELAFVPEAERWQRVADLAVAHEGETAVTGEPDDGPPGAEPRPGI